MHDLPIPAPLDLHRETVRPEWIDYNGHMNVAFYVLAFDHATDVFFDFLELGEPYRQQTGNSLFALEAHIVYKAELKQGETLRVTTQLLAHDEKRRTFFTLCTTLGPAPSLPGSKPSGLMSVSPRASRRRSLLLQPTVSAGWRTPITVSHVRRKPAA
jgi:acyl-CoA thioesterase FadM